MVPSCLFEKVRILPKLKDSKTESKVLNSKNQHNKKPNPKSKDKLFKSKKENQHIKEQELKVLKILIIF